MEICGHLRSLTWDRKRSYLTVVGGKGYVARIEDGKVHRLNSGTNENLRAVSANPSDGTALIVGNAGTVFLLNEDGHFTKLTSPSFENLRAVAWNSVGSMALIAGNNGALMRYFNGRLESIDGARANLRDVCWRPASEEALITSNCFVGEFIPSPNLFLYYANEHELKPVNEGRADLIGVDWRPDGKSALVVGYDVVWHSGVIAEFDGRALRSMEFENKRVYPTSVKWDPSGRTVAIGTATSDIGMGTGRICFWDGKELKEIYGNDRFFFSDLAWMPEGYQLAAVASTATRTFNA